MSPSYVASNGPSSVVFFKRRRRTSTVTHAASPETLRRFEEMALFPPEFLPSSLDSGEEPPLTRSELNQLTRLIESLSKLRKAS